MAEIIWKNKSNKEITGLIITDMPPITKPKMKVNKVEIDGRDGDVIENLGYESYTKNIGVGLTKNFDIDEVMKYFTGSGELVLSDEPNKVYVANIYDDIDYEKLLLMRKATIKFQVQPYKYLKDESKVILNIDTETSVDVINQGLEIAKPIFKIYGTGKVELAINGVNTFQYEFPDNEEYAIINSLDEEAYYGSEYRNRKMVGEFPKLDPGTSTISWTGSLTKIEIEPKSRWL